MIEAWRVEDYEERRHLSLQQGTPGAVLAGWQSPEKAVDYPFRWTNQGQVVPLPALPLNVNCNPGYSSGVSGIKRAERPLVGHLSRLSPFAVQVTSGGRARERRIGVRV